MDITPNAPICGGWIRIVIVSSLAPNVPSADERSGDFIFVDDSLEVIGVSLGEIVLGLERLTTLTLPAGVVADLVREMTELMARK